MSEKLLKSSGALLIITGALALFYWIVSFLEGFGAGGIIPSYKILLGGTSMEILKNLVITITSVIFSVGLIISGITFVKLTKVITAPSTEEADLEERINKLQTIVWKILQYVKGKA